MQLTSTYLKQIKQQLRDGAISCSDAILKTSRFCRRLLPEEELNCLSSELLGYSPRDVEAIRARFASTDSPVTRKRLPIESCMHRVLPGFKMKVGEDDQGLIFLGEPRTTTFFCDLGTVELEQLIADSLTKAHFYSAIDLDEESNTVFICETQHLLNLKGAVKRKVCHFLETLINDLSVPGAENTHTWSKQPLS